MPKKLEQAIEKRQQQIKGKDYNYLTENCADQIFAVLREAGAKDLSKTLGISIPKLDGVNSLDDWAEKNGHLVQIPKPEDKQPNLRHLINGINSRRPPKTLKFSEDLAKVRAAAQTLVSPEECRRALKKHYDSSCKFKSNNFLDKMTARREYLENYLYTQLPAEEVVRQLVAIINEYPPEDTRRRHLITSSSAFIARAHRQGKLTDEMRDMLVQTGYNSSALGRAKKIQNSRPTTKPKAPKSPSQCLYQDTGHTA